MREKGIDGVLRETTREPILINLVLLLQDRWVSDNLVPSLAAAFKEVELFYNFNEERAVFHYFYISKHEPRYLPPEFSLIEYDAYSLKSLWKDAEGRFVGTYNAMMVARLVHTLLSEQHQAEAQVIVIDQELTPPPEWRYMIWANEVISSKTTDPAYWGIEQDLLPRISLIKHRVRTACLSNVGVLIGLERCDNEECFLYGNVDSVLNLDRMVKLGPEHDLKALEGRGFEVFSDNPEAIQPIEKDPRQQRRFYES